MRGLLLKTLRETWGVTLLFGIGLCLFERLLMFVLPQVQGQFDQILDQMPFVRPLLGALVGTQIEGGVTGQLLQSFVWVHPVVLSLVWAHEIILCTRFPAGEIDRGTIDVLLGWPLSRGRIFLLETGVWLASGAFIMTMGLVGYLHGAAAMDAATRPTFAQVVLAFVNFYALYVAVGGVTYLVESMCDRRARAIGAVFGLLLASFLLNFLAQYWEPAKQVSFLSVLNYYRPAAIIMQGALPWGDVIVLVGVGLASWVAAGRIIARRSICTT